MNYNLLLSSDGGRIALILLGMFAVFFILPHILSAAFDKAEKEADKGNGSCLGAILIIVAIAVISMTIMQLKDCSNGNYEKHWEPRHTQLVNPDLKNVNILIFTSCKA